MPQSRFEALDHVFRAADAVGLVVESFEIDGLWHRVPVQGKKRGNKSGAYCLSELQLRDGSIHILGMLYNWTTGAEEKLTLDDVEGATPEEIEEARRRTREAAEASKKAKKDLQLETAKRAEGIWSKLPDSGRSPYLDKKGVKGWGIRFSRGSVVIPVRDLQGKLWSLQFIDSESNKRFLSGGAKQGRYHLIGRLPRERQTPFDLGFAEGYATGATCHEGLRLPIAITFDAGNLFPVSAAFRGVYPLARFFFFADHDVHKGFPQAFIRQSELSPSVRAQIARLAVVRPDVLVEIVADDDPRLSDRKRHSNTGVAKAILAAAATGGFVIVPKFDNKKGEESRER